MNHKTGVKMAMLALLLTGLACKALQAGPTSGPATSTALPTATIPSATAAPTLMAPISSNQPFEITGSFKSTSEIQGKFTDNLLYSERMVMLVDLHGFITRDKKWELPVNSQVIGHVQYNPQDASGTYTLFLPEIPQGTLNDVDNNGQANTGVQVFAVDYEQNIDGDPFLAGNDRTKGWPTDMASIRVTTDDNHEVTGGQIIVYTPDAREAFPSDFGKDGKLFTPDDPTSNLPAGYSIVNLDTHPFTISQPATANLALYEAPDAGPKDYSKESYTQAFDDLVKFLRTDYAFNGITGKQPDYDSLVTALRPRVQQAEKSADATAFYTVLRDFSYAFKDGHSGISEGGDYSTADFQANYLGSLGFTVRVLDNNQVLVNSVLASSAAETGGMKVGAIVTKFNNKPVMDVIKSLPLFFGNQSSPVGILYNQAIMLTRAKPGGQAQVTFTNPGGQAKTVDLTAVPEVDTLLAALGYNQNAGLVPVELRLLPDSGGNNVGYIKINTNKDDLNLILRLFERGLQQFQDQKIKGLIIDLRDNGGGVPLGLAGYLTSQDIQLGQVQYFDSAQGKFVSRGDPDLFTPSEPQYHFDKIAVLVGLNCASACEMEAYGFSKLPGAVVVGQYPSSGIEAEVSKGQVKMPEGIGMQFPTGRIVNADGSLFLEGVGVQPTIKVPLNAENVLSSDDVILKAALAAVSGK